ncbi:hypothetical protein [Sphingomonas sp. RS2018]
MKTSRKRIAGALGAALLAGAAWLPATGQDRPESILPPGFGDPAPTPAPSPQPGQPAPILPPAGTGATPGEAAPGAPTPSPTPTASATPIDLSAYELPASARRSLATTGVIGADVGGLPANAFGAIGGATTAMLMHRLDAPIPSRWLSIALRRALVSRVDTPAGINGADFAADRAWLLLRMGEADAARAVVQSVDVDTYSPRLFQVAMQAMLATGDPAGLCPLVEPASAVSAERGWSFARAMCAALSGKPEVSKAFFAGVRRRSGRTIDSSLAEKVAGAAASGAVTIEWDGVDRLTAWRYGLATATGVAIPDTLMAGARPHVAAWRATSPMLDAPTRASVADYAASQGVLSNAALVDLYSEIESADDSNSAAGAIGRDLRTIYADGTPAQRMQVMRRLWTEPTDRRARFARSVLTARAAAVVAPSADLAEDAPRLIASMLTAGLDRQAARWWGVVPQGGDAWALLALGDPRSRRFSADAVEGYAGGGDQAALKTRMLLAGLAGLGRLSPEDARAAAQSLDVRVGLDNSWTRAIDAAAERGEAGTVLLLFAVGMQTPDWRGVPPEVLYRGCDALRRVGMGGAARMIAAEAIARL